MSDNSDNTPTSSRCRTTPPTQGARDPVGVVGRVVLGVVVVRIPEKRRVKTPRKAPEIRREYKYTTAGAEAILGAI